MYVISVLSSSLEVHPAASRSALRSLVLICHSQCRGTEFPKAALAIPAGPAERKKPPPPSDIVLDSAATINYTNATEPELLPFLFGRSACRAKSSWRITHPAVFLCASAFGFLRRLGSKPSCLINSHFILLARALDDLGAYGREFFDRDSLCGTVKRFCYDFYTQMNFISLCLSCTIKRR